MIQGLNDRRPGAGGAWSVQKGSARCRGGGLSCSSYGSVVRQSDCRFPSCIIGVADNLPLSGVNLCPLDSSVCTRDVEAVEHFKFCVCEIATII